MSPAWIDYEWAVVRIVPHVHREQFQNVGVILHARTADFLDARIELDWDRLSVLAPDLDRAAAERHLEAYLRICRGEESAGPVALLPPSERFHWLTEPRSGILQTSSVHPGRCQDPAEALSRLFEEQVH